MESEIQEKGLNQFCTIVYEVLFYVGYKYIVILFTVIFKGLQSC